MRIFFFVAGFVVFHACAVAEGQHDISQRMQDYWANYSTGEYAKAAEFILPADLSDMKNELLPVFIAASQSSDQELQSIAKLFFSQIPSATDSEASPSQVFIGFNRFISSANPELFSALEQSSIEVIDIAWASESEAIVSYRIVIQEAPLSDTERFKKLGEQWYLRLKEPPRDTATKFRQAFGL